jgi:ubiquinone biosynthesis protein
MFKTLRYAARLLRAGRVLAQYDALVPHELADTIPPSVRTLGRLARFWPARNLPDAQLEPDAPAGERLAAALHSLGPSFIKLGQFLATRPDILGLDLANALKRLQDRLPPFSMAEARAAVEKEFGKPIASLFEEFGEPVAAASIAQVHKARLTPTVGDNGQNRQVAVKILRPNIEAAFKEDLGALVWAANLVEWHKPSLKRLEPVRLIETLRASVEMEMDLRLEAAAASELAEKNIGRQHFRVPSINWQLTSQRVITMDWVDGVALGNRAALVDAGHAPETLARSLMEVFLTQALEDGFFHADLHPGNLFVDARGRMVAVDFGIMGRLDPQTRRYLANILLGFLMRDYEGLAEVHFDAGYVPASQSKAAFVQALRSIGEPIFGREASEISMARLLAQLFQVTEVFNMHLQPQLVLLQKTMVVVEGVARTLDPHLDFWEVTQPIVESWMTVQLGPEARLKEAAAGAVSLGQTLSQLPDTLRKAENITAMVSAEGLRLHPESAEAIAEAETARNTSLRVAIWIGAAALTVIAAATIF